MTKKQFEQNCKELEANGWTIISYEPKAKKATYTRNGEVRSVG